MTSRTPCTVCLRLLRDNARRSSNRPNSILARRSLSTGPPRPSAKPTPPSSSPSPDPPPSAPPRPDDRPDKGATTTGKIAKELRRLAAGTTETYVAFGATERLYKECARAGHYSIPQAGVKGQKAPKTADGEDLGVGEGWWYDELKLTPTFSTWAQITILHLHLLTTRLRYFPPAVFPHWHQHLLDHFFHDAETRMLTNHNMHARGIRTRYLKDLFVQYRGAVAAYDEGLAKDDDAVLATAVWRNVFAAREGVDCVQLAVVVSYFRRVLAALDRMEDEVVGGGALRFGDPGVERKVVEVRSLGIEEPFGEEDLEGGEVASRWRD